MVHAAAAMLARERERVLQEAQDEAARCLAKAQEQAVALTTAGYEQGSDRVRRQRVKR